MKLDREIILSSRLAITPFTELHLTERYLGWLREPKLMRFSEQRFKEHTLESCRRYMESFVGTSHFFWAIEEQSEGLGHIGNINAYIDVNNSVADLGILIGEESARSRGYGLEAWQAVCNWLLNMQNIRKISAGTLEVNEPMLRLMRRAGMIADGVRKHHYFWEGREVDIIHMALFNKRN